MFFISKCSNLLLNISFFKFLWIWNNNFPMFLSDKCHHFVISSIVSTDFFLFIMNHFSSHTYTFSLNNSLSLKSARLTDSSWILLFCVAIWNYLQTVSLLKSRARLFVSHFRDLNSVLSGVQCLKMSGFTLFPFFSTFFLGNGNSVSFISL